MSPGRLLVATLAELCTVGAVTGWSPPVVIAVVAASMVPPMCLAAAARERRIRARLAAIAPAALHADIRPAEKAGAA